MMTTRLASLLLLAFTAGCPGPATPAAMPSGTAPAAAEVNFTFVPVQVGDKYQRRDASVLDMRLTADDGTPVLDRRETTLDADFEVLEVEDGYATKVRVTHTQQIARSVDGQAVPAPAPLHGVTALVWRGAAGVDASTVDGGALPPDVHAAVIKEHSRLGLPDTMDVVVAHHAWRVGEAVPLSADELRELDDTRGSPTEPSITSMVFTLREVQNGLAMFDVTQLAVMDDGGLHLDMNSVGTVKISLASGRAEVLDVSGTLTGAAAGKPLTADAQKHAIYSPRRSK